MSLKLILTGDYNAGKTSLLNRFEGNPFTDRGLNVIRKLASYFNNIFNKSHHEFNFC